MCVFNINLNLEMDELIAICNTTSIVDKYILIAEQTKDTYVFNCVITYSHMYLHH